MSRSLAVVFCILQIGLLIDATGRYSVIGPGTIRSNSKYNVAVSVHKADGVCKIKLGITGPSYNETKEIEVQPMTTENVQFDVPKLSTGDYNLTAVGTQGIIFENSTKLNHADNKPSIFIQTDKATYKPADLVQFRVLFLDENTRPAKIEKPITIAIEDGAKNRIKQLTDVKLTQGVYTGELQLSEQPVLGDWFITVSVEGEGSESKSFEVAKYVLPKFEVSVEAPKDVARQDGLIKATVRAKYTYGKPVKGKATVSIEPNYAFYGNMDESLKQQKTIDIDGKGHVEFAIGAKAEGNSYTPPVKIFAIVEEELTGNKLNASAVVNLHAQRYQMEQANDPDVSNYKPGEPFVYKVVVKRVDGAPVQNTNSQLKLSFERGYRYFHSYPSSATTQSNEDVLEFKSNLDEHGMAAVKVTLPEKDDGYFNIKATFEDATSYLGSVSKFVSTMETPALLKIEVNNKPLRLGKDVAFEVKSSEEIPYFVYTIVARGNIVQTEHIEVPDGRKSHIVKFTPSFAMVPQASIFIHYVFNNELRFEEQTMEFQKEFENSIDITAPVDAKPSEEVKLEIKTDAGSFVGLLGVDQSVLLLKSGNDLSQTELFNSLDKHKTATPWQRGYGRYPGQTSGLVTMTNANYPYNNDELIYYALPLAGGFSRPLAIPGMLSPSGLTYLESPATAAGNAIAIRKEFPENWIFLNSENTEGDSFTVSKKIPDTITSWVVTGFSLNPNTGIALTKNPSKIRVFQPFFVSTNLPYSVKRGEVIAIPVIIFNYMDKTLDAEVIMDNTDKEYDFTEATNEVEEKSIDEVKRIKRVTIPSNSGKSVSFMIRPKKVGSTTLKITATSPLAGDTIHQKLKVEPEGVTQFVNKAMFLNLKEENEITDALTVDVPAEAVPDSEYIEFSVVGDLLGPTIKNLDNLVRMPYGCGEQNMVNFVPNILVLKYLEVTNKKMPSVVEKARKFLEIGYQRELTYKHDDGSYSAFGKSDPAGSTWLTAYVVRSFHQAAKYTDVDPKVIEKGLDFLASKQKENGEFPEVGKLFDSANQNELSLTAFVLLAFFENEELITKYQKTIEKAVEYVAAEVDKTDDQYSLAISAVALQLAKHPQAEKVLAKLETVAKQENDRKWWSKASEPSSQSGRLVYWHPRSNDVEITSYILLALLEKEPAVATLPIIRWLIAQRNSNGGFASTQDTVMGLQALTKFAYKTGSGSGNIGIDFVATDSGNSAENKDSIQVNPENALVLQTHVLPKTTRQLNFTAKGQGSAMVQLSYRYNLADKDKNPSFKVTPTVKETASPTQLLMEICAEYVPLEDHDQEKDSNMAVMEIVLPSGYVSDAESFGNIEAIDRVKRVETKNSDSTVVVYFDSLTPGDVKCLPLEASKAHAVAKQKPAAVSLYDYYDTERRATEYYKVKSSLCDICEGEDCGTGCSK